MRLSAKFIMALSIMAGVLFSGVMGEFSAWASDDPCDNKGIEGINLLMITHGGQETSLIGIQEDDPGAFTIGSFTHTDSTVHYESDLILLEIVGECVPDDVSLETTMKLDLLPSAGEGGDSDRITLWEDQTKTTSLPLPAIFSLQEISSRKRLWIEAATPSKSQGDITICAELIDPEDTSDETTCQDTVNATAVSVRLQEVSFFGGTGFILTKQSLENLRNEGLPDEILEGLQSLEGQEFPGKNEFLDAIEKHIGSDQTVKYKELILKHVSRNDDLVVTADPRLEYEGVIQYTAPHWNDLNLNGTIDPLVNPQDPTDQENERQFPVVFVRNSSMNIAATFVVKPDDLQKAGIFWFKATAWDTQHEFGEKIFTIPVTMTKISGNMATLSQENVYQFNSVQAFTPLELVWEFTLEQSSLPPVAEDEDRWVFAGTSQNQVYVTFRTPETTGPEPPYERPVYHTLVHLGCDAAEGVSGGDGARWVVLGRIWEEFKKFDIRRARLDGQPGEILRYQGKWENGMVVTTEDLLRYADGECGAWTRLFIDTLKVQGLKYKTELVRVHYPHGTVLSKGLFLIKNWNFQQQTGSDSDYPYENVADELDGDMPSHKSSPGKIPDYALLWESADVIDLTGIAGQGNENPLSLFYSHIVVSISEPDDPLGAYRPDQAFYDPSYGEWYENFAAMKRVIAGYGYRPFLIGRKSFRFRQNMSDSDFALQFEGKPEKY